jgi:hypothetical protein
MIFFEGCNPYLNQKEKTGRGEGETNGRETRNEISVRNDTRSTVTSDN